jgi:hypothetical protein
MKPPSKEAEEEEEEEERENPQKLNDRKVEWPNPPHWLDRPARQRRDGWGPWRKKDSTMCGRDKKENGKEEKEMKT